MAPFGRGARDDVAGLDHDRRQDDEVDECAQQAAGRDRDAHEAADAEHRRVEREAQPQLADVGAEDRREVLARLADRGVVVRVEPLVERPRLLHARPLVHAQDLELQQLHPAVADDGLVRGGPQRRVREQPRLEHARGGRARVQRVEHHAARAAFGKRQLLVVDEAPLHREREQHADDRHTHIQTIMCHHVMICPVTSMYAARLEIIGVTM